MANKEEQRLEKIWRELDPHITDAEIRNRRKARRTKEGEMKMRETSEPRRSPVADRINRRNHEFWKEEDIKMAERMADPAILEFTNKQVKDQARGRTPTIYHKDFQQLLAISETAKHHFHASSSSKGGKNKRGKHDELQAEIIRILHKNPGFKSHQIREELKAGTNEIAKETEVSTSGPAFSQRVTKANKYLKEEKNQQ